jgi:hypothetical protein
MKRRHHLAKVRNDVSGGDERRLFGQFRWGAYSPAGGLERNGFLMRQLRRQRAMPRGRLFRAIAYGLVASWLAVFAIGAVNLLRHLFG